jgi:hypothetical protein
LRKLGGFLARRYNASNDRYTPSNSSGSYDVRFIKEKTKDGKRWGKMGKMGKDGERWGKMGKDKKDRKENFSLKREITKSDERETKELEKLSKNDRGKRERILKDLHASIQVALWVLDPPQFAHLGT